MKKLMVLVAVLAIVLIAASPAVAQLPQTGGQLPNTGGQLPQTGGVSPAALVVGAGALLVGGGLIARRFIR